MEYPLRCFQKEDSQPLIDCVFVRLSPEYELYPFQVQIIFHRLCATKVNAYQLPLKRNQNLSPPP